MKGPGKAWGFRIRLFSAETGSGVSAGPVDKGKLIGLHSRFSHLKPLLRLQAGEFHRQYPRNHRKNTPVFTPSNQWGRFEARMKNSHRPFQRSGTNSIPERRISGNGAIHSIRYPASEVGKLTFAWPPQERTEKGRKRKRETEGGGPKQNASKEREPAQRAVGPERNHMRRSTATIGWRHGHGKNTVEF